jgi:uncharacterized protein YebE (UPF0316 family)
MPDLSFLQSDSFGLVVLPILIFLARIVDVTIGTVRIIFVSRGLKYLAPILGFFEVTIWLLVITQIMRHLDSPVNYLAYGLGYATGNYVGILLEGKVAVGKQIVRVIVREGAGEIVTRLRGAGHGVTTIPAEGESGPVTVIFTIVKRRSLPEVIEIIKQDAPTAFYSVEDIRHVSEGAPSVLQRREVALLESSAKEE